MDGNADNPFPWFSSNDPVPAVDPADLRSMWAMQRDIQANVSGQVATDVRLLERACSPGADVQAAWYRLSMLQMVGRLGMLSRWLHDGELADAAFKVAATFTMKKMSAGVPNKDFRLMCRNFSRKSKSKASECARARNHMNRLCIETRGISNWRDRLAKPDTQWKRRFSAFETAVSWENASCSPGGLPEQIAELFRGSVFGEATLLLAIAEHKVPLIGGLADSQCDVWALLSTPSGHVSLSVEAKANEPFGQGNQSLKDWLAAGESEKSRQNRQDRWKHIAEHLPGAASDAYSLVPYQLLHRCAAAVMEAERFSVPNAAFVVQAFQSPDESFEAFSRFCQAVNITAERGQMQMATVEGIRLGIGWADCLFATNAEVAAVA